MNLNIAWLYPNLMSTYGDRGNIIALKYRSEIRGIKTIIHKFTVGSPSTTIESMDIIFMGGAQDKQQEIVNHDLMTDKGKYIDNAIRNSIPCLFVCGAYQFLGKYYLAADGTKIPGLGIFDLYTKSPGLISKRLIGNIAIKSNMLSKTILVGFENHTGRTFLKDPKMAFAQVINGYGNNGDDYTEGILFNNAIGTYLHGSILPKNPELTDHIITKALEVKYGKKIKLKKVNDKVENQARQIILKRLKLSII